MPAEKPGLEDLGQRLHKLASHRDAAGNLDEAIVLYEQALEIRRHDETPLVALASTLHNLAVLCERAGQTERAAELWAEAKCLTGAAPATADVWGKP